MGEIDYVRFIHDMYAFNDLSPVDPNHRFRKSLMSQNRKSLVKIFAFSLMPNHYHMLVSEIEDGGISTFMHKLNMGYAKYFNDKYDRTGVLWQGIFKKIQIQRDEHFRYIPYYIHLNPLDLVTPEWRDGTVRHVHKSIDYLKHYRWSSFMYYNGIRNFPSLLNMELMSEILGSPKQQEQVISDIILNPSLAEHAELLEK